MVNIQDIKNKYNIFKKCKEKQEKLKKNYIEIKIKIIMINIKV